MPRKEYALRERKCYLGRSSAEGRFGGWGAGDSSVACCPEGQQGSSGPGAGGKGRGRQPGEARRRGGFGRPQASGDSAGWGRGR